MSEVGSRACLVRSAVCSSLLTLFVAASSPVSASTAVFAESLREYFKPLRLLPVIVPSVYTVGDVYEFPSMQLIHRSADCFEDLETRTSEITLAGGASQRTWFAELTAKLLHAIGLGASGGGATRYSIRFSDAVVEEAARADLVRALTSTCAHLFPLFDGTADWEGAIPLSRVVSAKIELFVSARSEAEARVEADNMMRVFGVGVGTQPLDAEGAARAGWSMTQGWLFVSDRVSPVAFVPAILPRSLGHFFAGERFVSVPWDPENEARIEEFEAFSDLWADTIPELVR